MPRPIPPRQCLQLAALAFREAWPDVQVSLDQSRALPGVPARLALVWVDGPTVEQARAVAGRFGAAHHAAPAFAGRPRVRLDGRYAELQAGQIEFRRTLSSTLLSRALHFWFRKCAGLMKDRRVSPADLVVDLARCTVRDGTPAALAFSFGPRRESLAQFLLPRLQSYSEARSLPSSTAARLKVRYEK